MYLNIRISLYIILLLLFALTSKPVIAEEPVEITIEEKIEKAKAILEKYVDENNVPGLSAALAVEHETVWTDGFGHADLRHMVPAGAHTVYRIASISKPFASVLAMMLVEMDDLDLDAPIQDYLPIYPEKRGEITTRYLLSHTSGIRHYRGDEFLSSRRYRSILTPLATFADDTLLFNPGDEYSYSTYGYTLASAVIEAAARTPLLELLEKRITLPHELNTLAAERSEMIIPNLASFYITQDEDIYNAPYVDNSNKWAGGGLVATAEDLVHFASQLLQGDIIQPSSVETMFTPQMTNEGDTLNYALGWRVGEDEENGKRIVWHTGGAMGGGGVLFFYPDDGLIYASLANTRGVEHLELAKEICRLFVGE